MHNKQCTYIEGHSGPCNIAIQLHRLVKQNMGGRKQYWECECGASCSAFNDKYALLGYISHLKEEMSA